MTDKEIIKALECLHKRVLQSKFAEEVTETEIMGLVGTLDLINRQQAEIENADFTIEQLTKGNLKLQAEIERLQGENLMLSQSRITLPERIKLVDNARAEAIKEYKNKVENDIVTLLGKSNYFDVFGCLNYRYKEMVGDDK